MNDCWRLTAEATALVDSCKLVFIYMLEGITQQTVGKCGNVQWTIPNIQFFPVRRRVILPTQSEINCFLNTFYGS